ncbi:MAG: hypothetical protein ABI665_24540 [Vicinamibacterales bacterium]
MTRAQIDALSDDPAEMQRQPKEMAGDAVLRIDQRAASLRLFAAKTVGRCPRRTASDSASIRRFLERIA